MRAKFFTGANRITDVMLESQEKAARALKKGLFDTRAKVHGEAFSVSRHKQNFNSTSPPFFFCVARGELRFF